MWIVMGLLLLSAALDVLANYCIKRSQGFKQKLWGMAALLSIISAFILLSFVLDYLPLGVAYAIWGSLGLLGTVAIDRLFFKSRLNKQGWLGVGLIILGMLVLKLT